MDNGQKYKQKIEKTLPLENVYAFERNILNVLGYSNIASLLISTVAFSAECYIKIILSLRLLNYILCGRINLHTQSFFKIKKAAKNRLYTVPKILRITALKSKPVILV